jgi:hypothetical protein
LLDGISGTLAAKVGALGQRHPPQVVRDVVVALCQVRAWRADELSTVLRRNPEVVRQNYLRPLMREGRLIMTRPQEPNDPQQAYRAVGSEVNEPSSSLTIEPVLPTNRNQVPGENQPGDRENDFDPTGPGHERSRQTKPFGFVGCSILVHAHPPTTPNTSACGRARSSRCRVAQMGPTCPSDLGHGARTKRKWRRLGLFSARPAARPTAGAKTGWRFSDRYQLNSPGRGTARPDLKERLFGLTPAEVRGRQEPINT